MLEEDEDEETTVKRTGFRVSRKRWAILAGLCIFGLLNGLVSFPASAIDFLSADSVSSANDQKRLTSKRLAGQ